MEKEGTDVKATNKEVYVCGKFILVFFHFTNYHLPIYAYVVK